MVTLNIAIISNNGIKAGAHDYSDIGEKVAFDVAIEAAQRLVTGAIGKVKQGATRKGVLALFGKEGSAIMSFSNENGKKLKLPKKLQDGNVPTGNESWVTETNEDNWDDEDEDGDEDDTSDSSDDFEW